MDSLGLRILLLFQPPLDRADSTHLLLELGLGMAIRIKDRLRGFT
jgi:hypothetical protein